MNFEEYENFTKNNSYASNDQNENRVSFFSLKEGEEAIVRFMHNSRADLELYTVHNVNVNNRSRRIVCLAGVGNPNGNCPLCSSTKSFVNNFGTTVNVKAQQTRVYVHLLHYVKGADGNIVAVPKIWDIGIRKARELCSFMDSYGTLSDMICRVQRQGKGTDTQYPISCNLPKNIFSDEVYVKDEKAFNGYSVLGTILLDRTAEEMLEYERTGNFPFPRTANNNSTNTTYSQNQFNNVAPSGTHVSVPTGMYNESGSVYGNTLPWEGIESTGEEIERPVRMY